MTHPINPSQIAANFVVLEADGKATPIAVSDRFYADLEQQFGDFKGRQLVSYHRFDQDWDCWEMHPAGDEFVCLLSGQVDFVLEQDGSENLVSLKTPGEFVLVPRGIWHSAKVHTPSSVLFITPGEGTQHRPL